MCDKKLSTKIFFTIHVQLAEMNGKMVVNKPLYVALAQRKEERRARLQVWLLGSEKESLMKLVFAALSLLFLFILEFNFYGNMAMHFDVVISFYRNAFVLLCQRLKTLCPLL